MASILASAEESIASVFTLAAESKESLASAAVSALLLQAVKNAAAAITINNFFIDFAFNFYFLLSESLFSIIPSTLSLICSALDLVESQVLAATESSFLPIESNLESVEELFCWQEMARKYNPKSRQSLFKVLS